MGSGELASGAGGAGQSDRRLPHHGTPGEVYRELGGDYFTRRDNPDRRHNRLVAQLQALGFDVELTAAA